ncbi:MAG: SGNH/GDSL hydrolase family protein [Paenibacillus sp.]|uniref:SGNH/GDSL hydrolase family protein n=1 Tax=Paenibacillus sp. TaxID=58172 RepID=UPI002910B57C|nr:SGNH/GDSL hydrolase family protein [Paenibacillus sp.]MDU4697527.1 SGNH/GDSL hydrolase family protein [Paenibacillus sp.]
MDPLTITDLPLDEKWFHGAVSLQRRPEGIKPWRIPYEDYELFPPDGIGTKAEICAGVRIRLNTNSSVLGVGFTPLSEEATLDCRCDGQLQARLKLAQGATEAHFLGLPQGGKTVEIYLPQNVGMTITRIGVEADALWEPAPDLRPRWVAYGSSITQCVAADGPSSTWPAIAARECDFQLTCLGFSGNCHLEPRVGRMIAGLSADFISLCVGINVYGAASLSPRTFKPAIIGLIDSIRDQHPDTPLLVISPIYATDRETNENGLGFTLTAMREEIRETVEVFRRRGDSRIYHGHGLDWFGEADKARLSDGLHPDAEGYKLMGERFKERMLGIIEQNIIVS